MVLHVAFKNSLVDNQKRFRMTSNSQAFLDDDGNIFWLLGNVVLNGGM
jgi:hypothetical protein